MYFVHQVCKIAIERRLKIFIKVSKYLFDGMCDKARTFRHMTWMISSIMRSSQFEDLITGGDTIEVNHILVDCDPWYY